MINAFVHGDNSTKIILQIIASKDDVTITVTDDGKGMGAEETSRLFERYYRGTDTEYKTEGTGLGLAIVRNIVETARGEHICFQYSGQGNNVSHSFQTELRLIKVDSLSWKDGSCNLFLSFGGELLTGQSLDVDTIPGAALTSRTIQVDFYILLFLEENARINRCFLKVNSQLHLL